ncbi:MAG: phosphoribosylaminoimidazolesuccinocarboxamide synthase [Ardenticatenaceae bacterium]|nr:phosphoribosylaminoimidazolesuccinocarboxamide synthase [Ardenticatenaceae bacterium]MCB8990575.1 phosphoribosylaminoimidazolesuccinocarboxamide synthase [Ardenticatenaceae bacterium]
MLTHEDLLAAIPYCLSGTDFSELGEKYEGKVRDVYLQAGKRMLVTTDRISAFDRVLGLIPYKGQVLNQLSAWWFENTADLVPNHVISVPDPNVTIAHEAQPLPIEVIVRGYITGVTKTSLWYLYEQGERQPYGISLPDDLRKNDPLPQPIITPTTKAEQGGHDERITKEEIVARGIVSAKLWEEIEVAALALFARGQVLARKAGLILVDTKYEMGLVNGRLTLIDEIHTPDSSRYWLADSYQPGVTPENFDKEFMRKWFAAQGYRGDGIPPTMPPNFIAQVAARYMTAYEKLTGQAFVPGEQPVVDRIRKNLTQRGKG